MAITRRSTRAHRRSVERFPYPDFVVVARGREDGGVLGVPCHAVDAANMCVKGFDQEAVGAPDVYS
jgi:hypothetical protein